MGSFLLAGDERRDRLKTLIGIETQKWESSPKNGTGRDRLKTLIGIETQSPDLDWG